jgi:hypothetical protein
MTEPATALDQRYSHPEAQAVSWEDTRRLLEQAEICFHTGPEEQKFLNLRVNPNVVLTTGANDWDRGSD